MDAASHSELDDRPTIWELHEAHGGMLFKTTLEKALFSSPKACVSTIDERVGRSRVEEALGTGAATIAVSCPFCLTMMSDGVGAKESNTEVKDIAELLAAAIGEGAGK